MFSKTVASIMSDFGKKITDLKEVQAHQVKLINKNKEQIRYLEHTNMDSQEEIGAAQKAINMLEQFVQKED